MTTREQLALELRSVLAEETPPNVGDRRIAAMVEVVLLVVEEHIWSKSGTFTPTPGDEDGGEFVPHTWRKRADDLQQERDRAQAFARVLHDLNRCEHGRHEGDACSSGCAGGISLGNPVMRLADEFLGQPGMPPGSEGVPTQPPLRTVGYDISGNPIVVPDTANLNDPDAWRTR